MKALTFFILFNFGITYSPAQLVLSKISFEQLEQLQSDTPRYTVLFIHTDWCRYCQAMDQTTLQDKKVIRMLNEHFYFVDLDAESREDITFQKKVYKFKPTGNHTGIHEMAEKWAKENGQTAYPALLFLNRNYELIFRYEGFLSARELLQILSIIQSSKE